MGVWVMVIMSALMLINVPIGISIGLASIIGLSIFTNVSLMIVIQRMFTAVDNFTMMALPFFIIAGELMSKGGISKRLIRFASAILGAARGGIGLVTVLSCMFFAAMSGSGVATTAAIGSSLVPEMKKNNYSEKFAVAITCSAGALGPIIPPSILFVTYGVVADVSIGDLFLGGVIPGILIGLALMVMVYIYSIKYNYGGGERSSFKDLWNSFKDASLALLMPIIILGGIYGGIFTPTEAAIVASAYSLVISVFIYKDIKFTDLPIIFLNSAITSATILFIVGTAFAFSWLLTSQGVPAKIADFIISITSNKYILLMLINIILLIAGCFIDLNATIIVLTPILLPALVKLGVSPLHFGVIMVVNMSLGLVTPPLGLNLYVGSGISNISIEDLSKAVLPFLIVSILILFVITHVPSISMALPELIRK
jgi:C4-dicarboxylate transporter DctM subunit